MLRMIPQVLRDIGRFLIFRQPSAAISTHWKYYLAFGMLCTWLVGVGRYWDNPRAQFVQYLGLGSIAYVFCLALLLWLLIWPLRPRHWSFRNVLVFVSLTSPPAILYAIPVERFMTLEVAQATNAWFLAVVAAWRVALLVTFLVRVARLDKYSATVATLLPLASIVFVLSVLNLEHATFSFMAGIDPADRTPHDVTYEAVVLLSLFSMFAAPLMMVGYVGLVVAKWRHARS